MYERLLAICASKGINITNLCKQVTGSSGNLNTWKKGYMRSDYLAKTADILGVTADYLLGREDVNPISIEEFLSHLKALPTADIVEYGNQLMKYLQERTHSQAE